MVSGLACLSCSKPLDLEIGRLCNPLHTRVIQRLELSPGRGAGAVMAAGDQFAACDMVGMSLPASPAVDAGLRIHPTGPSDLFTFRFHGMHSS